MRLHTLAAGGLIGLCFLAGIAFADVPRGLPAPILAGYSPYQDSLDAPFNPRDVMTPEQLGVMRSVLRGPDPAPAPQVPDYTRAWLDAQPAAGGDAEWECLTEAIYFEARGESLQGQFAVAEVILNRVDSAALPAQRLRGRASGWRRRVPVLLHLRRTHGPDARPRRLWRGGQDRAGDAGWRAARADGRGHPFPYPERPSALVAPDAADRLDRRASLLPRRQRRLMSPPLRTVPRVG